MDEGMFIAQREAINVVYRALPTSLLGYYYWDLAHAPLILLQDYLLVAPVSLHRSVFWEELGHHFTLRTAAPSLRWDTFDQSQERRALRWAAQHMVGKREWQHARIHNCTTVQELAVLWEVTTGIAQMAVDMRYQPLMSCACALCKMTEPKGRYAQAQWIERSSQ